MRSAFRALIVGSLLASCEDALAAPQSPRLVAPPVFDTNSDPRLGIEGAAPGETLVVHGFRRLSKWAPDATGRWVEQQVTLHAFAEVKADRRGHIDLSRAPTSRSSYSRPGPMALLWSGYPVGAGELAPVAQVGPGDGLAGEVLRVRVTRGDAVLASQDLPIVTAPDVAITQVRETGLVGVFAAPSGSQRLPTLIALHGSEGGDLASVEATARRFAGKGFATLAVSYFRTPWSPPIPGVPSAHDNIPVETIDRARAFLATRPEADSQRIGVWGVSKGAEFTAVAASQYPWIKAAVTCVGSDIVWEGYYRDPPTPTPLSSWSFGGLPLPYVPLIPFVANDPRFATNTDRYLASRAQAEPAVVANARIPIERAKARFLFIGSERDEVWASAAMSRALLHTRQTHGARGDAMLTFPKAGHQICGDGAAPVRLFANQSSDPNAKDLTAEGEATQDAWRATIAFLRKEL